MTFKMNNASPTLRGVVIFSNQYLLKDVTVVPVNFTMKLQVREDRSDVMNVLDNSL